MDPSINSWLQPDYYYYATAGGAKFWVFVFPSSMRSFDGHLRSGKNTWHRYKSRNSWLILELFTLAVSLAWPLICLHSYHPSIAYERMAFKYLPDSLPYLGNCAGSETAALFGCGLLTSYLGLFINFYFQTYKKPNGHKKPTSNGVANGYASGKANGVTSVAVWFLMRVHYSKFYCRHKLDWDTPWT